MFGYDEMNALCLFFRRPVVGVIVCALKPESISFTVDKFAHQAI